MGTSLRYSDTLWLRLACLVDEPFNPGVPWRLAPNRFAELERRGFVEAIPTPRSTRAVATDAGRQRLAQVRDRILASKQVAHG